MSQREDEVLRLSRQLLQEAAMEVIEYLGCFPPTQIGFDENEARFLIKFAEREGRELQGAMDRVGHIMGCCPPVTGVDADGRCDVVPGDAHLSVKRGMCEGSGAAWMCHTFGLTFASIVGFVERCDMASLFLGDRVGHGTVIEECFGFCLVRSEAQA